MQGEMVYIPAEMMRDVERMKQARKRGLSYEISYEKSYEISYDSKEEKERERVSPHTPLPKEEKRKEESFTTTPTTKKSKKSSFFPSLEEVEEYHKKQGFKSFTAKRFYDYYNSYQWKSKGGGELVDWQEMMGRWEQNEQNNQNKRNNETRQGNDNGAKGCTSTEEQRRRVVAYLDAHYPMAAGMDEEAVAERGKNGDSLWCISNQMGKAPVVRLMAKKLCVLDCKMKPGGRWQSPAALASMAEQLLEGCKEVTPYKFNTFLVEISSGAYPSLDNGLRPTRLIRALNAFLSPPKTEGKRKATEEIAKYKMLYE